MRILFSGYPSPFVGGGEVSALTLVKKLAQEHDVTTFGILPAQLPKEADLPDRITLYKVDLPHLLTRRLFPYHLRTLLLELVASNMLSNLIGNVQPELVIAQEPAIRVSRRQKARVLMFVRSYDYWFSSFYPSWWKRVYNEPFTRFRSRRNLTILQEADLVLANSKFTAKKLYKVGIKTGVVYPFIDLSSYEAPRDGRGEFILFASRTYLKGVDIVLQIAKELPDQKFVIVGSITESLKEEIRRHKNVELRGFCYNMQDVYAKAKIVLVPSLSEESFGRIPIEAGINGIPTVASNRGGLPESVGEGGILIKDIWDIEKWIGAIERLDNPKTHVEFSEKAIENAKRLGFEKTFQEFKELVDTSLNLPEPL